MVILHSYVDRRSARTHLSNVGYNSPRPHPPLTRDLCIKAALPKLYDFANFVTDVDLEESKNRRAGHVLALASTIRKLMMSRWQT
jgi:hypothetical protein